MPARLQHVRRTQASAYRARACSQEQNAYCDTDKMTEIFQGSRAGKQNIKRGLKPLTCGKSVRMVIAHGKEISMHLPLRCRVGRRRKIPHFKDHYLKFPQPKRTLFSWQKRTAKVQPDTYIHQQQVLHRVPPLSCGKLMS